MSDMLDFVTLCETDLAAIIGGNSSDIASNLKMLRLTKGVTQHEVASAVNVDVTTISAYENGRKYPSIDVLEIMADFYQKPIDDLVRH